MTAEEKRERTTFLPGPFVLLSLDIQSTERAAGGDIPPPVTSEQTIDVLVTINEDMKAGGEK